MAHTLHADVGTATGSVTLESQETGIHKDLRCGISALSSVDLRPKDLHARFAMVQCRGWSSLTPVGIDDASLPLR